MNAPFIDREMIYHKLRLLAHFIDHMGDDRHYAEFDSDDYFAMFGLLSSIADEVYPEGKQQIEQGKKTME